MAALLQRNGTDHRVHRVGEDQVKPGGGQILGLTRIYVSHVKSQAGRSISLWDQGKTYLSRAPPQNLLQLVLLRQFRHLRLADQEVLHTLRQVVQAIKSRVRERLTAVSIGGRSIRGGAGALHERQRSLQLNNSLPYKIKYASLACVPIDRLGSTQSQTRIRSGEIRLTQESQPIIETSPALIETLMRHRQPLHLVGQDLVAVLAEHAQVELVQGLGVGVDRIFLSPRVEPQAEGGLRARRRV